MYVIPNFKTKKALKEAVKAGQRVEVYQPGYNRSLAGRQLLSVEGPHYPEPHRWYARIRAQDGIVQEVLG